MVPSLTESEKGRLFSERKAFHKQVTVVTKVLYDGTLGFLKKNINHAHSRPGTTKIHSLGGSLHSKGKQIPGETLGVHTDGHCPQPPPAESVPQLWGAFLLLGTTENSRYRTFALIPLQEKWNQFQRPLSPSTHLDRF